MGQIKILHCVEYPEHANNLPAIGSAWSSQKRVNVAQSPSRQSAADVDQRNVVVDAIHNCNFTYRLVM